MKTSLSKLRKFFSEDELDRFCGIGLLTADGELIIEEEHKNLPLVNAGRTVYVLDPFTNGTLCSGDFDGKCVGSLNVYASLMAWNYPELGLENFTEDCVTECGEMLLDGSLILDPVNGKKYVHSYGIYSELCFPDIEIIDGNMDDIFFDNDDRTISELIEAGRLMEVLVRDIYSIKYPLKLSFNKEAEYDKSYETISVPLIEYIELKAVDQSRKIKKS